MSKAVKSAAWLQCTKWLMRQETLLPPVGEKYFPFLFSLLNAGQTADYLGLIMLLH